MAQQIPGVSKIVYKATGGDFDADLTVDGNDIATDSEVLQELIGTATAKGGVRHQGNKSFDFTLNIFSPTIKADLADHKNEFGDLEIYGIDDDTTAILTINNVNPMVSDRINFDPSDEAGAFSPVTHQGVNVDE